MVDNRLPKKRLNYKPAGKSRRWKQTNKKKKQWKDNLTENISRYELKAVYAANRD